MSNPTKIPLKSLLAKTFLFIPLLFSPSIALAQTTPVTVLSIGDGDTLRVREAGQVTTIRLGCVDSPERIQAPWGQQSTSRLKQLLPPGSAVQVREITRDRYGRTVAELYVGKKSINGSYTVLVKPKRQCRICSVQVVIENRYVSK